MGMGMGMGGNQMGFDAAAAYRGEREALSIVKYENSAPVPTTAAATSASATTTTGGVLTGNAAERAERELLGKRYPTENSVSSSAKKVDLSRFV